MTESSTLMVSITWWSFPLEAESVTIKHCIAHQTHDRKADNIRQTIKVRIEKFENGAENSINAKAGRYSIILTDSIL